MRYNIVLVVVNYEGKIERWRKYRTVKEALAHGRRNIKAGRMCWIEKDN